MMRQDAYAIVTGGNSGIGLEYTRQLAAMGYNILIVSNDEAALQVADELSAEFPGRQLRARVMNLARVEAAGELHSYCCEQGLDVEVLVNNAGVYHNCDFLDDSEAYNSMIMLLHVYTPTMLIYRFAKDMEAAGGGDVLNMGSVTSSFPVQRIGIYCSTKAYLKGISRSLHVELKARNVSVTCVRPGAVATSLYNLSPFVRKLGLTLGFIMTTERLARKGLRAMFRKRSCVTPGFYAKLLNILVPLIPVGGLKLIRKWRIY